MSIITFGILISCENQALHDSEEFRPREIHEDIQFNFDRIMVDGVEYLILEKDNNNPHEGFGFMAFRANLLMEKQDTLLAYMRAISDMQVMIYSKVSGQSLSQSEKIRDDLFNTYLDMEQKEIEALEQKGLSSENLGSDTTSN